METMTRSRENSNRCFVHQKAINDTKQKQKLNLFDYLLYRNKKKKKKKRNATKTEKAVAVHDLNI